MSESVHERIHTEPVDGCVVEFLDSKGIACAAYACGICVTIASRDEDGLTYSEEGSCERLIFDCVDHEYLDN